MSSREPKTKEIESVLPWMACFAQNPVRSLNVRAHARPSQTSYTLSPTASASRRPALAVRAPASPPPWGRRCLPDYRREAHPPCPPGGRTLATMDGSKKKEGPNVQDPKMEERNTVNGWTNFYLGSSRKSCNVKSIFTIETAMFSCITSALQFTRPNTHLFALKLIIAFT